MHICINRITKRMLFILSLFCNFIDFSDMYAYDNGSKVSNTFSLSVLNLIVGFQG